MLTADQVADYFILRVDESSGDVMTNLRLQKLVYYAQAWHLALTGEPLFEDDFEAWVHGPVIPHLYRRFKENGWRPIDRVAASPMPEIDDETRGILEEVWSAYGQFSATRLEELTHGETPWIDARRGYDPGASCSEVISQAAMHDYYAPQLAPA